MKTGQRSSSNVKCSLLGHSRYKVRSVMKYGCCFSQSTWGWDHHSVSDRKPTIIESPLQKLLSSSGHVGDGRVGVFAPLPEAKAPRLSTERGTSVNRPHSRGIKEPLHWFVLEAVLLICLPTNECIGPVFPLTWTMALKACINWPDVIPREWRALRGVWKRLSFHPFIYSTNLSHKNKDAS